MKKFMPLLLAGIMALSLAACGGPAGESASSMEQGGTAGATSASADSNSLNVILAAEFSTLDPQALPSSAEIAFCQNIFDYLVVCDDAGNVSGSLAKDWTASEDGLTYTFNLRDDVEFSNGDKLDADDVVLSIERFRDESWMQFASFAIDSAEKVDDYTVNVTLKYPYAKVVNMLRYCAIIDKDYFENTEYEEFSRNPIGSGPYKLTSWTAGQGATLEANENYWGNAPAISNVNISFVSDTDTVLVAMETGEADFTYGATISAVSYQQAESDGKVGTDTTTGNSFYYVNFNSQKLSKEVRQALSYATDREALNTVITEGTGTLGNFCIKEGWEGYTDDIATYDYDPEKAKELLTEAGADGLELTFYYASSVDNKKLGETLQSQWAQVGVTLDLEEVESGTWWANFTDGNYDVSRGGYPVEINIADTCYYDMFNSNGTFNVSQVKDSEIDSLLEEARVEQDASKRDEIYQNVNQIMADEAYYIPLYWMATDVLYNKDLQGVKAVASQEYHFADFSWTK